jgi:general nucleoside transport system permease protein
MTAAADPSVDALGLPVGPAPARLMAALDGLIPFLIALLVGGAVLALTGRDVLGTYLLLAQAAVGGTLPIANTLTATTPVLLTGIATATAFRAGVFNVGVEGSLYLGAFAAAWVGFSAGAGPGWLIATGAVLAAALVGLVWAAPPGVARAWWGVDEIVSTLMLNYVAILLTSYLVNYRFLARGTANSMSPVIDRGAQLAPLVPGSQLTVAFPIALLLLVGYAALFRRTTVGYELRMVGASVPFARAAGMDTRRAMLLAMLLSGAVGGLAGAFQVLGVTYRFIDNFSPGYGFTGIAVALVGRSQPLGLLLSALFFGALANGGGVIQLFSDIPLDLVNVLQGAIMIVAVTRLARIGLRRPRLAHA